MRVISNGSFFSIVCFGSFIRVVRSSSVRSFGSFGSTDRGFVRVDRSSTVREPHGLTRIYIYVLCVFVALHLLLFAALLYKYCL